MRAFLRQPGGGRQSNRLAVTGLWSLLSLSIPSMAVAKTAADYFVHSLPGQPEGPLLKMHAGYVILKGR
jgi:carboxypeptidase D